MADEPTSPTHYVYSFYARDGRCLYVGRTKSLGNRLKKHSESKPWWGDVVRIDVRNVGGEDAADFIERLFIQERRPVHNVTLNGGGQPRDLVPECRLGWDYFYHLKDGRILSGMYLWTEYDIQQNVTCRIDDPCKGFDASELEYVASTHVIEQQMATVYA